MVDRHGGVLRKYWVNRESCFQYGAYQFVMGMEHCERTVLRPRYAGGKWMQIQELPEENKAKTTRRAIA